jgi:hypothetical protein
MHLVARLRAMAWDESDDHSIYEEAADLIEEQAELIEELTEELETERARLTMMYLRLLKQ